MSETTWERVDEQVLRWVATLPPAFTNEEILDFRQRHAHEPFEAIPELSRREVYESLVRLHGGGFIGAKGDFESLYDLRLAPRGLVYLGEWPDIELVTSAVTMHRLLRAAAEQAPEEERGALERTAGVLGRTASGVLRDTIGEIAHEAGEGLVE